VRSPKGLRRRSGAPRVYVTDATSNLKKSRTAAKSGSALSAIEQTFSAMLTTNQAVAISRHVVIQRQARRLGFNHERLSGWRQRLGRMGKIKGLIKQ